MSAASKRSALSISFVLSVSWLTVSLLPEVAAAVTGYVRVSQIGYEAGLPARAYVMTTRQVSSVMFKVINSVGRVVASGSVGARLGSWAAYSCVSHRLHHHSARYLHHCGERSGFRYLAQLSCRRGK